MTRAIVSQSAHKWRFGIALTVAAGIHLAAISFATVQKLEPPTEAGVPGDPPEISLERGEPNVDPPLDVSEPLPTPPVIDPFYVQETATPPPVRRTPTKFAPPVRPPANANGKSVNVSEARVFALNAPRPEYPYEARRQKITGDGIALLTIDPSSGEVIHVSMSRSTGNPLLDNAALAGLSHWRFKPGTVSTVTCPITFTLAGVAY
ncbi:MAG: energy transducer TonB [Chthoniobacterales bacterium]